MDSLTVQQWGPLVHSQNFQPYMTVGKVLFQVYPFGLQVSEKFTDRGAVSMKEAEAH